MTDYTKKLLPRFRYGVIHPRAHEDVQRGPCYQLYRLLPNDFMEVATGLGLENYTQEGVDKAIQNYWSCVDRLVQEKVDHIVLSGAPIAAVLTRPRVLQFIRETKEKYGIPVDSPLEALIAACKHLDISKLAVGSRWADPVNNAIVRYLKEGGIEVVGITKRNQWASDAFGMSLEQGMEMALEVGREAAKSWPDAEGISVPGGAAMALHVIPAIEEEFGKPAFTNMSAEVWYELIRPGIIPPVKGWGKLLAGER
jgi:maleate cis-trans isomerase